MANTNKVIVLYSYDEYIFEEGYEWVVNMYFGDKITEYALSFDYIGFFQDHSHDQRLISVIENGGPKGQRLKGADLLIETVPEMAGMKSDFHNKPIVPPVQTGVLPARRGNKIKEFAEETDAIRKSTPSPTRTPQGMTRVPFE